MRTQQALPFPWLCPQHHTLHEPFHPVSSQLCQTTREGSLCPCPHWAVHKGQKRGSAPLSLAHKQSQQIPS